MIKKSNKRVLLTIDKKLYQDIASLCSYWGIKSKNRFIINCILECMRQMKYLPFQKRMLKNCLKK